MKDKEAVKEILSNLQRNADKLIGYTERYSNALLEIAKAGDQANPSHLVGLAKAALEGEPTTADKHNHVYISDINKEIADEVKFVGDIGTDADFVYDSFLDESSAELAKFDREMREEAESTWRNTVLHPEYKSEYDSEDDTQLGASIVKSNDNVKGVFISNGEVKQIDYTDEEE